MSTVLARAQGGEVGAFEVLVTRWSGTVCAIALSIVKDVSASEDIAQDVFVAVWQRLPSLQKPESFGAWVRQIARNQARLYVRGEHRRRKRVELNNTAVDWAADDVDPVLAAEERRVVQAALEDLPDDARDVMVLFYREGQSIRQVATLLDLSESAVKKRLSRARAAVRADVLASFETAVVRSAPGAALTALVVAAIGPAPAIAATAAVVTAQTGGLWGAVGGLLIGGAVVGGVFLGYRHLERVVAPDRIAWVHRARNLSVGALAVAVLMGLAGPVPAFIGLAGAIGVLGYVQFFVLPKAWAPADGEQGPTTHIKRARLGTIFGAMGWLVGGACGLMGLYAGTFWP